MRRFCNICLSPACHRQNGACLEPCRPIRVQWDCRTSVSQAVPLAKVNWRLWDFNKGAKRALFSDMPTRWPLQTGTFRVEWHLALKSYSYSCKRLQRGKGAQAGTRTVAAIKRESAAGDFR